MMVRFQSLNALNQKQAKARFMGAGKGDGFVYELDRFGAILCRRAEACGRRGATTPSKSELALRARLEEIEQEKVY